jgi:hypothetical protein
MKRPGFIVQRASNETSWFYRTGCLQWNALVLLYRMPTMKRPGFIVQMNAMKRPDFGDVLKLGEWFNFFVW